MENEAHPPTYVLNEDEIKALKQAKSHVGPNQGDQYIEKFPGGEVIARREAGNIFSRIHITDADLLKHTT